MWQSLVEMDKVDATSVRDEHALLVEFGICGVDSDRLGNSHSKSEEIFCSKQTQGDKRSGSQHKIVRELRVADRIISRLSSVELDSDPGQSRIGVISLCRVASTSEPSSSTAGTALSMSAALIVGRSLRPRIWIRFPSTTTRKRSLANAANQFRAFSPMIAGLTSGLP